MMKNISWLNWQSRDIWIESQQAEEEGRNLSSVQDRIDALQAEGAAEADDFQQQADGLLDDIRQLPLRADYAMIEPSDLAGIKAARPDGPRRMDLKSDDAVLADKIHGAWLGRCAGCLAGKHIEGIHTKQLHGLVRSTGATFLTDYIWRMGVTQEACEEAKRPKLLEFGAGINCMPSDDDINYTIIGMRVIQGYGMDFTPTDMANVWMRNLPVLMLCTAERVAYRNFVDLIAPPQSAVVRNPYREWIGAQIRADFFGYVALGRPELAAELAWRDACISHIKNGIYGEMWVAAMLAAAAAESDLRRVIEIGLSEIPADSRLAAAIGDVLTWHAAGVSYDDAVARIHERWDETNRHHWCHTISNAQIVATGLLWSDGDYEKAVTRAIWPCFDTDCNGATVGSIMGMVLGAKALPEKWTGLMCDTVRTAVSGYNCVSISGSAAEMFELFRKARES